MANGLEAHTEDMSQNSTDTLRGSGEFLAELGSLENNVEGLRAIYRGDAADQFFQSYDGFAKSLQGFQETLESLGTAVGDASRLFEETEEENARAAAGLFDRG